MIKKFNGTARTTRFSKQRKFADINEGYASGFNLRKGMDDPAELIRIYANSVNKALVTRQLVRQLARSDLSPYVIPLGKGNKLTLPLIINTKKVLQIMLNI